jgi:predicted nucleic acid-binding protein
VLGIETKDALLVLDDIKARNIARSLGIRITGTLGIILKAKEKNLIPSVKIVLSEMEKASFRISEDIKKEILRIAKEK